MRERCALLTTNRVRFKKNIIKREYISFRVQTRFFPFDPCLRVGIIFFCFYQYLFQVRIPYLRVWVWEKSICLCNYLQFDVGVVIVWFWNYYKMITACLSMDLATDICRDRFHLHAFIGQCCRPVQHIFRVRLCSVNITFILNKPILRNYRNTQCIIHIYSKKKKKKQRNEQNQGCVLCTATTNSLKNYRKIK